MCCDAAAPWMWFPQPALWMLGQEGQRWWCDGQCIQQKVTSAGHMMFHVTCLGLELLLNSFHKLLTVSLLFSFIATKIFNIVVLKPRPELLALALS